MARVLVGVKRVVDYAVKVSTHPKQLNIYKQQSKQLVSIVAVSTPCDKNKL